MSRKRNRKSITVLGQEFKIIEVAMDEDHGQTLIDKCEIKIDPSQAPAQYEATLLHEVLHAALAVGGLTHVIDDKLEEGIVRCLEHALTPLVKFKESK